MKISLETTLKNLVNLLIEEKSTATIIFSDKDLPSNGPNHNKALHIISNCCNHDVPLALVDNDSVVNVCPLRTAKKLGKYLNKHVPTTQGLRAYDNSRRHILETSKLNVTMGCVEKKVEFHVIDIPTSFNLFLGWPWLHALQVVPSTLHQNVKMVIEGEVITIEEYPVTIRKNIHGIQ